MAENSLSTASKPERTPALTWKSIQVVKGPARQTYIERTTVLKAIASAQGFTDFAKKKAVRLSRVDGRKFTVNCVKAREDSSLDLEVYPGDRVFVPRKIF